MDRCVLGGGIVGTHAGDMIGEIALAIEMGADAFRNPIIKACCQRLLAAGKLPKVALVACMRKLLTTFNAMVRNNSHWDNSLHSV